MTRKHSHEFQVKLATHILIHHALQLNTQPSISEQSTQDSKFFIQSAQENDVLHHTHFGIASKQSCSFLSPNYVRILRFMCDT